MKEKEKKDKLLPLKRVVIIITFGSLSGATGVCNDIDSSFKSWEYDRDRLLSHARSHIRAQAHTHSHTIKYNASARAHTHTSKQKCTLTNECENSTFDW